MNKSSKKATGKSILSVAILFVIPVVVGILTFGSLVSVTYAQGGGSTLLSWLFWNPFAGDILRLGGIGVLKATNAFLEHAIVPAAGAILGAMALLLDLSIDFSINSKNYAIPAVDEGWKVFRDVANIGFIFVLLYIGIGTILRANNFNTKNLLVGVIIAALLINFSLFFTKVAIDVSNQFARVTHNLITDNGQVKISEEIQQGLNLTRNYEDVALGGTSSFLSALLRIVTFLIAAWAFLSVAMIFVGRTVAFIFLMLLAPIGFVGGFIPGLGKWSAQWWSTLLKQAIVAPIFLILLYVIILIIQSGAFVVPTSNVALIFNYAVIIGLIIVAVRLTKQLGGEFGSLATKSLSKVAGTAMSIGFGAAGFGLRQTLGRGASALSGSEYLKRQGAKSGAVGFAARQGISGLKKTGSSSLDFRNIPGVTTATKAGGIDVGKAGGKGGYEKNLEDQVTARVKMADTLGTSTKTGEERAKEEELRKDIQDAERHVALARDRMSRAMTDEEKAAAQAQGEEAKKFLDQQKKALEVLDKKVAQRGTERKEQYLTNLATKETFFGLKTPRKNKEAAAKARKVKTSEEKMADAVAGAVKSSGTGGDSSS